MIRIEEHKLSLLSMSVSAPRNCKRCIEGARRQVVRSAFELKIGCDKTNVGARLVHHSY